MAKTRVSMTTEQLLRKIRQQAFAYPPEKDEQLSRVIGYLKQRALRTRCNQATGPYSGLTRAELRRSGTCETDWY